MDFGLSEEQQRLQERCRVLAADFALRSAEHDRDASHPIENYRRLAWEGFLELTVPREWGGAGLGLLDHTIAFEALAQGCPSTALAFNMHASVVMPVLSLVTMLYRLGFLVPAALDRLRKSPLKINQMLEKQMSSTDPHQPLSAAVTAFLRLRLDQLAEQNRSRSAPETRLAATA